MGQPGAFRRWFQNLKTLQKLTYGFAAVSAIILVVGLVSLLALDDLRKQLQLMYEGSTLDLATTARVGNNLGAYHEALQLASQTVKTADFENALEPLARLKQLALAPLADLEGETQVSRTGRNQAEDLTALRGALDGYFLEAEGGLSAIHDSHYSSALTDSQRGLMRELGTLTITVATANAYQGATLQLQGLLRTIQDIASDRNSRGQHIAETRTQMVIIGVLVAIILGSMIGYGLSEFFSRGIGHIARVAEQAAAGNLQARAKLQSTDELGQMAGAFNKMLDRITGLVQTEDDRNLMQTRLMEFLVLVSDVSKGDLTRRGEVTADMFGNLADAFNLMLDRFGTLLHQTREAASHVHESATSLLETAGQMSETAHRQAEESMRTLGAVESLAASMRGVATSAGASSESANQVLVATERGNTAVQETVGDMQTIRSTVQRMSKQIKGLGDRSIEISQIVNTIRDIASQTNLLALNAAIEAAGAGEAGARFGVVADQVRKLAENSSEATREIGDLVKLIQAETQEAVAAMEHETQAVEAGSASALRTGEVFKEISQIAERSAGLAQGIANAAADQTRSTEDVGRALKDFTSSAVATQSATDSTRQTVEEMAALADGLAKSVRQFKIA